jgi:type IV pilus assembly protein PilM|tara:strand:+ start:30107 stop:31258 length:1152 start_codon:yes stop_codon:yes gene_type:complete
MNQFLDLFKQLLKVRPFKKAEGSVLGVDIGSSSIKVVQLRKKRGAAVLETYGEISLGPYGDVGVGRATNLGADKLAEALRDVLKEASVTTKDCGVSIPFSSSLITLIEMPDLPEGQLKEMIPIEARKYIPVPIGEVSLDWFVVPEGNNKLFSGAVSKSNKETKGSKIQVLLVAIHNETLSKYRTVLKDVGLAPTFFEIEIFSTIRAVLEQGVQPVMIVDVGAATTKLYIVEYGIVRTSHIINRGSQNITTSLSKSTGVSEQKAEQMKREMGMLGTVSGGTEGHGVSDAALAALDYIFSEARRTLIGYQKKYNRNIGTVILTGGGIILPGLLPFAQKQFETEVRHANPFSKVETPAFLEETLRSAGPEFAVSVGLALRKLHELE